jgi:hypothetical protein
MHRRPLSATNKVPGILSWQAKQETGAYPRYRRAAMDQASIRIFGDLTANLPRGARLALTDITIIYFS